MQNRRYTKAGMREAHADQVDATFRLSYVPRLTANELVELEAWLQAQLSKLHQRFIWKRDRLQCKLGTVRCEMAKRGDGTCGK